MSLYNRFLRLIGVAPRISAQVSDIRVVYAENSNMMCITFDLKNGRRLVKIEDYQDQDGQITVLATYSKPQPVQETA
jgi:hypothetical protein